MKSVLLASSLALTTLTATTAVQADSVSLSAVPSTTVTVETAARIAARERREFPMHSARIDRKQHKLASRVEYARKDNKITQRQYNKMQSIMNSIHNKEAYMKRDHRLNKREIQRLNKMLKSANQRLTQMIRK